MQQSYKARLKSAAPLLINNGQLANPLHPISKEIKKITGKRNKTEADLAELGRLEWYGSLYLKAGQVCIPSLMLDATLINAAKKTKQGMIAKAGLFSLDDSVLEYDGPKDIDQLWEDESFRFVIGCRPQGKSTVIRTRPIFNEWEIETEIAYNDELLNETDIERFLTTAGRDVGFGNWRPRYGRFELVK